MWDQWLNYYMHIEQLYTVYSNLRTYTNSVGNCLCVNRREPGLHFHGKHHVDLGRLLTVWKDEYIIFPNNTVRLNWDGSPMGNRLY